jgi:hypothetical protein
MGRGFEVHTHTSSPLPVRFIIMPFRVIHQQPSPNRPGTRRKPRPVWTIAQVDRFDVFLHAEQSRSDEHDPTVCRPA